MRQALAALAVFSLLAVACGGVESEPNLAKAVDLTTASGSSRIEGRAHDDDGPYTCEGAADYTRKRVRISCDSPSLILDMIAVDGDVYTRYARQGYDAKWGKSEDDPDNPLGGFSPELLLSMLREASSEIVRIGEEDVRGTSSVRYRLTVDREQAELGEGPKATVDVDIWIDDDGLVRRIQIEEADGFTLDFFDFGVDVDIQAPPADQLAPDFDFPEPGLCTPGEERPFRIDQVRRILRNHGFDVRETENGCLGGVAAILTNAGEDDRDYDELLAGPGQLTCFVLMRPSSEAFGISTGTSVPRGKHPYLTGESSRENLECTLFADKPNADEAERRLDRAYDELERATP